MRFSFAVVGMLTGCCVVVAAAPDLLWLTSPTLPDETVVAVYTSATPNATGKGTTVRLCRGEALPTAPSAPCAGVQAAPRTRASDGLSAMFTVPSSWPLAVYAAQLCRSGSGVACSGWARINDADPLWAQADRGAEATAGPSGWLRIFGRALAFGPAQRCTDAAAAPAATSSSVRLVAAGGAPVVLTRAARGSCYDLAAPIPATTAPGEYSVQVKNSLPGSSWVTTSDGQKISVVRPRPAPSKRFAVKGQTGRDVAEALEAAGRAGGGTVELGASVVYRMAPSTSLYIPDRVTLTTAPGASGRGVLLWDAAAPLAPPHGQHSLTWCRGPGQQLGIWQGNLSARLAECPPLIWGNGSFTIANIHARAPAVSALVELVEPSFGAVVRDSLLEVVGFEERGRSRTYVNVSK